MTTKSGIFISYARKDGESFANTLRARLAAQAPDIRVWLDRPEIEGGVGWWRQIEAALERVEFLVIVMTNAALESEVTGKEWRAARQAGVCVYPVKGPGFEFDDPRLPRWMKKVQVYDLEVQWETFIAHLRRGCQATRVPFMAPPPPVDFVARPREFAALKELFLNAASRDAIAVATALTGAGGFGKTTLAAALCHADEIVSAFDDGILWTTLGQTPHLQNELTVLYANLTGERPGFVSIEDAAQALAEKLERKTCLIVVDDVWEPAHLKPFLRGGPECARLITTRQDAVASEATRVSVNEMTSIEAVALLLARMPASPTDVDPIRRLAARLGEWPLLLKLAGGAMRSRLEHGDTLGGALNHINRALDKRGITAFDRERASERNEAVASTMDLSLELLAEADRQRCTELAIFPEDVAIPVDVIGELWGLDRNDTDETLIRLDDASFVEFDLRTGTVSIHDIMRAYLGERLKRTSGTALAHARLLATWPDTKQLPHEYAWRWIGYHLHGAGQSAVVTSLLLDLDWLARKLQATDIYSLISDFRYAVTDVRLELRRHWMQLSSHVLARDKAQFASQLLARVADPDGELSGMLVRQLKSEHKSWLRPRWPSLSGPGGYLIRTLDAQGATANDLAVTSGGQIVSPMSDGSLQIWDFDTGSLLRHVLPAAGSVSAFFPRSYSTRAVALLPDGRILVAGLHLWIWDWQHSAEPEKLIRLSEEASALAVSADGERALVGTRKGVLRLYDLPRREILSELKGHRLSIESVAITPDGRRAASGGYEKSVKLWDLTTGELIESLYPPHEGIVYAVAISPDGTFVVSGSADRRLRIWDLGTRTLCTELTGHTHRVYAVAISADGTRAISGSHDRTLKLWDLASAKLQRTFEGHADAVGAVAFTPDSRYAVSAAGDSTMKIWQLDATQARPSTQEHAGWIHALAITRDGRSVFTAGQDHVVRIWDVASGRVVKVLPDGHHDTVSSLALSNSGSTLVSGSFDRALIVWDLTAGQPIHTLQGHADAIAAIAIASDGTRALSGSLDGVARLWDLERGRLVRRWDAHRRGITFVATNMDGRLAVTGSGDGTLRIWEVDTGSCLETLNAHHGGLTAGGLVFEDTLLLSGGADGTVRLWRFPSGELLKSIALHTGKVRALAVLPGGKLAASGGYDCHVRVWTLEGGKEVASFATDSPVIALACCPDSPVIVAGDAQGNVHFLRFENNSSAIGFHL